MLADGLNCFMPSDHFLLSLSDGAQHAASTDNPCPILTWCSARPDLRGELRKKWVSRKKKDLIAGSPKIPDRRIAASE